MPSVRTPLFWALLFSPPFFLMGDPATRVETNGNLRVETPLVDRDQNRYRLEIREEKPGASAAPVKQKLVYVRTWDEAPTLRRLECHRWDRLPLWRMDFDPEGRPARFQEFVEGRAVRLVELSGEGQILSDRRLENGTALETRWRYAALESGRVEGRPASAGSWPVERTHLRDGVVIETVRLSWQAGLAVREERLNGAGSLVEILDRDAVKAAGGRLVTETRRRADGREIESYVRTEDAAGHTILAKSSSGFTEVFAWDARNLLSRQTLRDAVRGRAVIESAWSWQSSEAPVTLFSPPARQVSVARHESWKIGAIFGLRDHLVIRHRDGSSHEERLSYVRTNGASPLSVATSVEGVPQARMDFDARGRLLRKTLLDADNRVRGRYEFSWEEKGARLTSMAFNLGQGPAVRSLQFHYRGGKSNLGGSSDPLNPPDLFFTWGQGLYELAKLRIGADAGNLELQGQDLAEALIWMERLGLERMVEVDGRGEAQRLVRFIVERPKNALHWVFESYARTQDDEERRAEQRLAGAKPHAVYAQDRDELDAGLAGRFKAFALAKPMGGEAWESRAREYHERTLEFWSDPSGAKFTAGRLTSRHTGAVTATRVVSGGRTPMESAPGVLDELWQNYTETLAKLKPQERARSRSGATNH